MSVVLLAGCARPPAPQVAAAPSQPAAANLQFADVTEAAGIRFTHFNGATGKRYMVETMGAGGAFLDYDGDGWLDILLLNGRPLAPTPTRPTAALYHNNRDGTFTDVTRGSGLDVPLYAMGCCVADYDNDGDDDLYVSCALEPDHLFRNEGGGKFQDVTRQAGVDDEARLGTSCAWLDYDNDGWLDLFVCHYVRYSLATDHPCYEGGKRYYCRPTVYHPDTCALYHNRGNGTFEDVTKQAGIWNRTGNSLGVAIWDFDDDGWQDIAVANDLTPNYLFHNIPARFASLRGSYPRLTSAAPPGQSASEGRRMRSRGYDPRRPRRGREPPRRGFEEVALDWGIAFGENGRARAGMGIDVAEYRNDGQPAILISNFTGEPLSFFVRDAPRQFSDIAFQVGVGEAHLRCLGFGLFFFDCDNDGDQDAFVGNGHIEPSIGDFGGEITYGQRNHLYRNLGDGTFAEIGQTLGPPFRYQRVTRGAAYGDYDNDGDLDILVTNNGQPAELLRNDGGNRQNWLQVELRGTRAPNTARGSDRDGIGARVTVRAGSLTQRDVVRSGSSYLSQSMLRRHFGLGSAAVADEVDVRWPSGTVDRLQQVKANQRITIVEGQGQRQP